MERTGWRAIAWVLVMGTVSACGSDDPSGGGTAGAAGSTAGAAGSAGSAGSGAGGGSGSGSAGTAGGAGMSPCTATLSGDVTGTVDCTSSTSSKALGIASESTVGWVVTGDNGDYSIGYTFTLDKPPTATTYEGTADVPACNAIVQSSDFLSAWVANSRDTTSSATCSITFDSVTDTSSGSTSTFVVHGSATASLVKASAASTVTMNVTF